MITLQHSLVTLMAYKGDKDAFRKNIPYVLLPDAIRAYMGPRQLGHFEESADGKENSWVKYPEDLSLLSKEYMEDYLADKSYLSPNIKPCCIGENTHIGSFYEHNEHLPEVYFRGIEMHLKQDMVFDQFIRKMIDCSDKYNGNFYFGENHYDDKEVRALIASIEKEAFYYLAKELYEKYGITTDQQWFDENVKTELYRVYPQDLAEKTYKYMQIDPRIQELIKNHDWSEIDKFTSLAGKTGNLTSVEFEKMYDSVYRELDHKKDRCAGFSNFTQVTDVRVPGDAKKETLNDLIKKAKNALSNSPKDCAMIKENKKEAKEYGKY